MLQAPPPSAGTATSAQQTPQMLTPGKAGTSQKNTLGGGLGGMGMPMGSPQLMGGGGNMNLMALLKALFAKGR